MARKPSTQSDFAGPAPAVQTTEDGLAGLAEALRATGEETPAGLADFLVDLCTPAEIRAMGERWRVAQLVHKGMPYREVSAQTGVSTATITRVARAISQGTGGYRRALVRKSGGDSPAVSLLASSAAADSKEAS